MRTVFQDKAKHISKCLELAILLEVSANKPGNVNLMIGFEGTRYEHFLASAVAASPFFELSARQGAKVSRREIHLTEVGLGRIMKSCVADISAWQRGGNTLLGTIILLTPIAVAAGMASTDQEQLHGFAMLRKNLKLVVESTTPEDTIDVYEAIRIANPSGLGTAPRLDVNDPDSIDQIRREKISLYDTFVIASEYDNICSELVRNYPITFDVAYPYMMEQIEETGDQNVAIIHTFLKVLATYPDTFIARKVGFEKARKVSSMAMEVLKSEGLRTSKGRKLIRQFDSKLRKSGNDLNPGTTADIITAAIGLCILKGYRP